MLKVKYEIFSNSVFICCSVLSSILTVLLFSEMNLYFGLRSFKLRKYAKCKIKSCFYIHLTHFKLSCGVPYILLPTSIIKVSVVLQYRQVYLPYQIFGSHRTPRNICCDILLIGVSSLGVFLHFLILTFFLFDFFLPEKAKKRRH